MKKLLVILLCLPMIGFGQKISNQLMTPTDVVTQYAAIGIIGGAAALVGGFDFLIEDDYPPNGKFKISSNKDSINWNSPQFTKWKIIVPKDLISADTTWEFGVN